MIRPLLPALGFLLLPSLFLHAEAEPSPNLVPNAGMEEVQEGKEPIPIGWRSMGERMALRSTEEAHEGSRALEIRTPEQHVNGWVRSESFRVDPNTVYRLRASFLSRGDDRQSVPFYGVRVYESDEGWNPPDGEEYLIAREDLRDNGREWKIKEATFRTRETAKWIYIGILLDSKTPGVLLVDDVVLERVP